MSAYLDKLQQAFNSCFDTPKEVVTSEATPDDIEGWDSLGHAMLCAQIEEQFAIELDIDEMMAMDSVAAIIKVLTNKGC